MTARTSEAYVTFNFTPLRSLRLTICIAEEQSALIIINSDENMGNHRQSVFSGLGEKYFARDEVNRLSVRSSAKVKPGKTSIDRRNVELTLGELKADRDEGRCIAGHMIARVHLRCNGERTQNYPAVYEVTPTGKFNTNLITAGEITNNTLYALCVCIVNTKL